MNDQNRLPHLLVVGGGFAGLWATRALAGAPLRITLLDRSNHHLFQPLLYQVATAGLSAPDIAAPLRHILRRQRNVEVRLGEASTIDPAGRRVALADGSTLGFDYLLLASGATHAYFGHDEWAEHAPGLKSLDDALHLRRKLLLAFERAEACEDPDERAAWLSFAVVGGGPTGVELAGTLAEIARHTLRHEFRHIDPTQARVRLIEAGPPSPLPKRRASACKRWWRRAMAVSGCCQVNRPGIVMVAPWPMYLVPMAATLKPDCWLTAWDFRWLSRRMWRCLTVSKPPSAVRARLVWAFGGSRRCWRRNKSVARVSPW